MEKKMRKQPLTELTFHLEIHNKLDTLYDMTTYKMTDTPAGLRAVKELVKRAQWHGSQQPRATENCLTTSDGFHYECKQLTKDGHVFNVYETTLSSVWDVDNMEKAPSCTGKEYV